MKKILTLVIMAAILLSSVFGAVALTAPAEPEAAAAQTESGGLPAAELSGGGETGGAPEYAVSRSYTITRDNVRVYGRQEPNANTVFAYWEGAGIGVRFTGAKLTVTMTCSVNNSSQLPYFQVWVDGERTLRFNINNGSGTYTVAEGLGEGEHFVRVLLTTQSFYDQIQFVSMAITGTGAALLEPEYDPDQLIMDIYGDSITAGHGTLGHESDYTFRTNDATSTYAFVTAEHFGADANICAISGWGVYQGYNADLNGIIPRVWNYISMKTSHIWTGFADRQCDIVTVALGTNDMWFWKDDMPRSLYIDAYLNFLGKLREVYPEASFFLLHNMMDDRTYTDPDTGERYTFCDNVAEVARRFCDIDEIGATFIHMPSMYTNSTLYTGSGGHPSEAYSYAEYHHLAEAIEERFYGDWEYKLLAAAEALQLVDTRGDYAELIASAKQTAADWHSTGRNPKRFCKEIEAIVENINAPIIALDSAIAAARTALAGNVTETERRVLGILSAKAQELIDGGASAGELNAAAVTINDAISNVGNAGYFEGIDLGGDAISVRFSLDGEDFGSTVLPERGAKVYVRVLSAVSKDEISGKLAGDPYRSSRRGVKLNTAEPESENYENGVYEYVFSAVAGASEGLEIKIGGDELAIAFEAGEDPGVPQPDPEFAFVSEALKATVVPEHPAAPVLEVSENAVGRSTRLAVIGGDAYAAQLVWETAFGAGTSEVYTGAGFDVLTACVRADDILAFEPDVVMLNVSSVGLTVDEDREAYESLVRKLLTADKAPAVLCVLATGDSDINAARAQVAAAYGLPCADADSIITAALADGYPTREIRYDNGRITDRAQRMITETAIYGLYAAAGREAAVLPEPSTALSFLDLQYLNPANTTPKSLSIYTVAEFPENEWETGWKTASGRGTIKFDVEDCRSIIVVYADLAGKDNAAVLVKAFGKNKSKALTFEPYSVNAFIAYLGDPVTGELALTTTFRGEAVIYGVAIGS
ncbi:MAG: hypothetical protein J5756_02820 [Clostridia bacterium]|nr:hypothetical protein [Clostridia bacterium]